MPLPPEVRRQRRAAAAKLRDAKTFPRRRCMNCSGWYLKTRKNKKFCGAQCKDEFNRYGSAFGPLKDYLTKLIEAKSKEEAARQFAAYVAGKDFRRQLAAAGFIHRSMLQKKPPEQSTKFLARVQLKSGRILRDVQKRLTLLETALRERPDSWLRSSSEPPSA